MYTQIFFILIFHIEKHLWAQWTKKLFALLILNVSSNAKAKLICVETHYATKRPNPLQYNKE